MLFYKLKIKDIQSVTPECKTLTFELPEEVKADFKFKPGQYLTLRDFIDGEEFRRNYSICSSPYDENDRNCLTVAVKKVYKGRFSHHIHENYQVGDEVEVYPPLGNFIYSESPEEKKNYVFIAAGSGITPVISMIKSILKNEKDSEIVLIYGNAQKTSVIFKDEIDRLKNKNMQRLSVFHVFSREKQEAEILNGRIDREKVHFFLHHIIPAYRVSEVFICGPEELMLTAKEVCIEAGIDSKNIHFELFNTERRVEKDENISREAAGFQGVKNKVHVELDGDQFRLELQYPEQTVLDVALKNGLDLPYACRGGVCATCKCLLIEGEVDMDINYALEEDELEKGYILACQSHPRTEEVRVTFDVK